MKVDFPNISSYEDEFVPIKKEREIDVFKL